MYDFDYQKPSSLSEIINGLKSDDEAKVLAGGMTLIPTLKQRLARPSRLLDLGGMHELKSIKVSADYVVIGAMVTHASVAASVEVKNAIPALAKLAGSIGDPHVRHRGTVGGSIANNDPAADYPAAVLGLGASIQTNERTISGDDFFTGMFETALRPGELIIAVAFPIPATAAYVKFRNPASRYAITGVFVARMKSGARVAVTGAGPCVFRQAAMEAALDQNWSVASLDGVTQSPDGLTDDLHGTPDYRAHLVGVLARRAAQAMT